MRLKYIKTANAPKAVGPYSQAVLDMGTNVAYVSGQIAIDAKTNIFDETQTAEEQTKKVLQNLGAILEESGSGFKDVLKVRIYLVDISDFNKVNAVYETYFSGEYKPARVTIGVSSLPLGAKIEIECEAKI